MLVPKSPSSAPPNFGNRSELASLGGGGPGSYGASSDTAGVVETRGGAGRRVRPDNGLETIVEDDREGRLEGPGPRSRTSRTRGWRGFSIMPEDELGGTTPIPGGSLAFAFAFGLALFAVDVDASVDERVAAALDDDGMLYAFVVEG